MPFELPADPGDPGRPDVRIGHLDGSQAAAERRLIQDGVQLVAHGALVCPECVLPLAVNARLAAGDPLRCAFCDHVAPARAFVREDVFDTVRNEVYLVARVA
jgi:hypothetical protein